MSHAVAEAQLVLTVRREAVMADGRKVLIEASGPGTTWLERKLAERQHKLWNEGLRPNRLGIWRKP